MQLRRLVQGDSRIARPEPAAAAVPAGPPTDVCGYDEHQRTMAWKVPTGVAAILVGIAIGLFFEGAVDLASVGVRDGLFVIIVLAGVLLGLVFLVPAGMEHTAFQKAHPYVEDFYTEDDRARARKAFSTGLVAVSRSSSWASAFSLVLARTRALENVALFFLLLSSRWACGTSCITACWLAAPTWRSTTARRRGARDRGHHGGTGARRDPRGDARQQEEEQEDRGRLRGHHDLCHDRCLRAAVLRRCSPRPTATRSTLPARRPCGSGSPWPVGGMFAASSRCSPRRSRRTRSKRRPQGPPRCGCRLGGCRRGADGRACCPYCDEREGPAAFAACGRVAGMEIARIGYHGHTVFAVAPGAAPDARPSPGQEVSMNELNQYQGPVARSRAARGRQAAFGACVQRGHALLAGLILASFLVMARAPSGAARRSFCRRSAKTPLASPWARWSARLAGLSP